jgi:hypothetical protein
MGTALYLALITTGLAYVFDFVNGFHDTANAVTTIIYTKAMKARNAIIMSGLLNLLQQESKALTRVRSQIRVPAISSSRAGTACRFNGYDERCRVLSSGKTLRRMQDPGYAWSFVTRRVARCQPRSLKRAAPRGRSVGLFKILQTYFRELLFYALRCIRAVGAPTLALLLPRLSHIRLSNPPCLAYYYYYYYYYFALYETTSPAVTWGGFGAK